MKQLNPRNILWMTIIFLAFGIAPGCSVKSGESLTKKNNDQVQSPRFPTDMALIYHGNTNRLAWNAEQLKPYLYTMENGKPQWLFDGFLFLEIFRTKDGKNFDYRIQPALQRPDWEWLIQRTFRDGSGPDALEELMAGLDKQGFKAPYKRKVVLSIPNPVNDDVTWGELNGKKLDFHSTEDRVAAATWFADRMLEEWKKKNYKYLELAGFYWLRETINNDKAVDLVKAVGEYVHQKKLDFYWIPYYGAKRAGEWKNMGFDIAYQQPNYFFNLDSPHDILTGAIDFGKKANSAFEMEFDARLMTNDGYMKKYNDYIDEFGKEGIWQHTPVAYYEGGDGWYKMSQSSDPKVRKAFQRLSDTLVVRKSRKIRFMK